MSVENQARTCALEVEDCIRRAQVRGMHCVAFAIRRQKLLRQIFKLRKISLDFYLHPTSKARGMHILG